MGLISLTSYTLNILQLCQSSHVCRSIISQQEPEQMCYLFSSTDQWGFSAWGADQSHCKHLMSPHGSYKKPENSPCAVKRNKTICGNKLGLIETLGDPIKQQLNSSSNSKGAATGFWDRNHLEGGTKNTQTHGSKPATSEETMHEWHWPQVWAGRCFWRASAVAEVVANTFSEEFSQSMIFALQAVTREERQSGGWIPDLKQTNRFHLKRLTSILQS